VTYDAYVGMTQAYHLFKEMDAAQYIEHKNKAWVNLLGAAAPVLTQLNDFSGNPIDTKWSDLIYQKGMQHNHALTFSGSTPTTNYFLSIGYTNQQGMVKKNSFERKNARLNLDHKLNKYISLGANIAYTNGYNESPNTGSLSGAAYNTAGAARLAFVLPPILAPYLNDGSGNYNLEGAAIGRMGEPFPALGYFNPVAIMALCKYTTETDRLLATVMQVFFRSKGLNLKHSTELTT
jgi:hypothetical protein